MMREWGCVVFFLLLPGKYEISLKICFDFVMTIRGFGVATFQGNFSGCLWVGVTLFIKYDEVPRLGKKGYIIKESKWKIKKSCWPK